MDFDERTCTIMTSGSIRFKKMGVFYSDYGSNVAYLDDSSYGYKIALGIGATLNMATNILTFDENPSFNTVLQFNDDIGIYFIPIRDEEDDVQLIV